MNISTDEQALAAKRRVPIGWIVAVLLVIVAWLGAYALRGGGDKEVMPGWADGMPAGQQLAQEADKPMVVLFTAGWCGYCQTLKKNVLTKDEVHAQLQADFVPVQIDLTDQSANNPNMAVASKYGVQGIPAVIAMTPDGEPLAVYNGDDVESFTAWLKSVSQQDAPVSLR